MTIVFKPGLSDFKPNKNTDIVKPGIKAIVPFARNVLNVMISQIKFY